MYTVTVRKTEQHQIPLLALNRIAMVHRALRNRQGVILNGARVLQGGQLTAADTAIGDAVKIEAVGRLKGALMIGDLWYGRGNQVGGIIHPNRQRRLRQMGPITVAELIELIAAKKEVGRIKVLQGTTVKGN